jgi:hypothetical protein
LTYIPDDSRLAADAPLCCWVSLQSVAEQAKSSIIS